MTRFVRPRKTKDYRKEKLQNDRFLEKMETLPEPETSTSLNDSLAQIRNILGSSNDLVIREFTFGNNQEHRAALVYFDGLISARIIDEHILKSLMSGMEQRDFLSTSTNLIDLLLEQVLPIGEAKKTARMRDVVKIVLAGDSALLVDSCEEMLLLNTKGWEKRGVQEPMSENVVRGPRDSFTETLRVNSALLRRRIKDPDLRVVTYTVGVRSNTDVCLVYIDGVADEGVVREVGERIQKIEVDGILDGGNIEQFIEDNHWSPFPLIQNTERPDKAAANLLEGKVVIIVDGSPFVLIAPAVLTQFYHSPEDYYERFLIATMLRLIRAGGMTLALLLPSLYIAFSSYHPEMIPSKLVIAMAAGRATVPFPSFVEAFIMEISIEILREASVRLPGPIGPTIGIVGALIVGESAVRAGIVSPIMVIVVALTTIGSFAAPSYNAAIALRMLRFPAMIFAATFGLYGIMQYLILIIIHLCTLKSFGVPYLAPFTPGNLLAMGDSFIRIPLYRMWKRPNVFTRKAELTRTLATSAEGVKKPNEPDNQGQQN
ncbi:spore germination protein [Tumebacillus sp. ITR2]|uniref:Spore germination protein n=1 Tax=Tumebacillus amylolyticus TaxID=2801339 RepID=A0ABS1JFV0_9BACL|nr:spore germination protein [Tumebacillus amylolyticus]MBL0389105.1 spore germination protein [Tumebacillus amylolyticus]